MHFASTISRNVNRHISTWEATLGQSVKAGRREGWGRGLRDRKGDGHPV